MPGTESASSPGRRQPVRGVASQNNTNTSTTTSGGRSLDRRIDDLNHPVSSASLPWETPLPLSASAVSGGRHPSRRHSASWQPTVVDVRSQQHRSAERHFVETHGQRPFSSGLPAPATAVPIFGAGRANPILEFPDSPPSTPPHSPPLTPRAATDVDVVVEGEGDDTDLDALGTPLAKMSLQQSHNLITDAANAIFEQQQQQSLVSPTAAPGKAHPTAIQGATGSGALMPATPEVSPDKEVQHFARKSAEDFFHRIFTDFAPASAQVEDAGVELVCPGWSGAVLKTGTAAEEAAGERSTSYGSSGGRSSSSSSSSVSKRTLYVSMPRQVDQSQLRELVLALLDAASDRLGCGTVILCLDPQMRDFATVLHGLCYVGGQVVSVGGEGKGKGPAGQQVDSVAPPEAASWRSPSPASEPISGCSPRGGLVLVGVEL
ncbi:uncharacterized protein PFL1_03473 [Pseudozyma flocculosa PF-1]|uniref:Ornithine decarboxylase antizyme n=1 Tax=Pseudozyma flocculosa PF-1 TaxID=1277687 RepID=A0A061HEX4_9BASI|nr:uncharacterized protein PFL1_03473 [Pseudozyma flocculosa PF-1]EPQ29186.1 hypothetical protein PFL1_03473 [Pseudozyma flocculosa PF-1]